MSIAERARRKIRGLLANKIKKIYISPFIISYFFYFVKPRSAERPGVRLYPSLPPFNSIISHFL